MDEHKEEAIRFSKKYLEDLLSFFGLNTDVYASSEDGEVIELSVPSTPFNSLLIGNHADTLRSFQYLVSMALRSHEYAMERVNIDIADYKKQRADRLRERAQVWVDEVKSSEKEKPLEPMNAADRRTVHKFAEENGVQSRSEGEARDRHIVLLPPKKA